MRVFRITWALVLALLAGVIAPPVAVADVAPLWSSQQLVDLSAVVLRGRVARVASGPDGGGLYTYVTVDVAEVLKGWVPERQITIKQLGGEADGLGLAVFGQAQFAEGEDVLLFLEVRPRDNTLYTTALWQGKWTIERDATGNAIAVRRDPSAGLFASQDRAIYGNLRTEVLAQAGEDSRRPNDVILRVSPAEASIASPFVFTTEPYRWNSSSVNVDVQATGQPGLAGGGFAQIQAATSQWNASGANFAWSMRSMSAAGRCASPFADSGITTVVFNDPCAEISNTGGTLAVATAWYTQAVGSTVNGQAFRQVFEVVITTNDSAAAAPFMQNANCFQSTILHEFGHALGLGHTTVSGAIMEATVSFSSCSGSAPVLHPDDQAGIRAIYPGQSTTPGAAPATPTGVTATVSGSTLSVVWGAVTGATSYRVDFRQTVGGPVLAQVTSTAASTALTIPAGTTGTFIAQVTAINAAGSSQPSAPASFTIGGGTPPPTGCTAAPAPPTGLTASISGGVITVSWSASAGAASYIVRAGSAAGGTNLFNGNVGAGTSVSSPVGAGFSAFIRVAAVNACGTSADSVEIRVP